MGMRSTWIRREEFQPFRPDLAAVWGGELYWEVVLEADGGG